MAKHTPKPWVACFPAMPDGRRYFPHVHLGGFREPGIRDCGRRYIVVNEGGSMETCDANARLIEAAPEQQEKIDALADVLEEWVKPNLWAFKTIGQEGSLMGRAIAALRLVGRFK